jgi:hypothetical protein
MEPRKDRTVIRFNRNLDKRRSLAWLVATLLLHGVECSVCDTANEDLLVYRTEPMMFLKSEYSRWYNAVGKKLPDDIVITLPLLIVWSVEALANSQPDSVVKFHLPPIAAPLTVDRLAREAAGYGFVLRVSSSGITHSDREELGQILLPYVPRAAWDSMMPVEVN